MPSTCGELLEFARVVRRDCMVLLVAGISGIAAGCGSRDAASRDSTASPDSAARAPVTATIPAVARRTVLFVGTSLTAGQGLEPDSAFPQLIQQKIDAESLPFSIVNAGYSGETTAGLLRRLDWLLRGSFDVVVVETGANDGLRGIPPSTVRSNLEQIVARIRAARPAARLLLVQMEALPNFGPQYTSGFREIYRDIAKANGLTLLPFLLDGVAGQAELNQGDGIHPNMKGEHIVAENVWKGLKPVLEELGARN
jgi:acyl-CoA thioesterase-1